MWLFPQAVAPWQPADSLAILKLMALQSNGQLDAEVLRARVSLVLPPARVADILPETPGPGSAALPEYARLVENAPVTYAGPAPRDPLFPVQGLPFAGASNAWAADASRCRVATVC